MNINNAAQAIRAAFKKTFSVPEKLQHKSLLLFCRKKVIVKKGECCSAISFHRKKPPGPGTADIIPRAVDYCKGK